MHIKRNFQESLKNKLPLSPADKMMYSKSDLLKMIIDNEQKQQTIKQASPTIKVTEAIHGTYKTNFVLKKRDSPKDSLPLGKINESKDSKTKK